MDKVAELHNLPSIALRHDTWDHINYLTKFLLYNAGVMSKSCHVASIVRMFLQCSLICKPIALGDANPISEALFYPSQSL
jgi:hypothetical protein